MFFIFAGVVWFSVVGVFILIATEHQEAAKVKKREMQRLYGKDWDYM